MSISIGNGSGNSAAAMELQAVNILFDKYGKDYPVYNRGEKVLTRDEIPVELFPDTPDVLDDLGLTQQRKDMTEAQNKMINIKNEIAIRLEKGALFPEYEGSKKNSPFKFESMQNRVSDSDYRKRLELMENALKAPAISDPEYRAMAAEYLEDLIPAAKAKKLQLLQEINSLEAEYAQLQHEYRRKIQKARADLKIFMKDLDDVTVKRFQLTDTGKATEAGHPAVELQDVQFWKMLWLSGSKYVIERLEWIQQRIDAMNQEPDEEEQRAVIRSNWKAPVRDASGSGAPVAGVFSSLFGKRG